MTSSRTFWGILQGPNFKVDMIHIEVWPNVGLQSSLLPWFRVGAFNVPTLSNCDRVLALPPGNANVERKTMNYRTQGALLGSVQKYRPKPLAQSLENRNIIIIGMGN